MRKPDFFALERLVINQADSIDANVQSRGKISDRFRFLRPTDLRVDKVLMNLKLFESRQRERRIISTGDRLKNASLIQFRDDFDNTGPERDIGIFDKSPLPKRVVEVPDYTFNRLIAEVRLRFI